VRRFQFQPFRRVMKFCEKYGFFVGTPLAITWGWINGHILARLTGIVGTSPTFVPKALAEHMRNLPAGENLPSLVNDLQEMAVKPGFSGFWLLSFLLLGPAIFYGLSGRGREKPAEKWYEHNLWGLVRKKIGRPLKWGGVALSVPVIYTGINGMFGAPWFLDLYNWFALSRANGLVFTLSTVISTVGLWLAAGGIEGVYGHNFFKPLTEIPGWFRRNVWLFSSPPVIPRKNQVYLEPSADIVTYGFGTRNPRPNLPPLMDVIRPKSPEEKPRAEGPAPAATTEASEAPPAQDENQGRPVEES
jgi:hypothetical protein